MPQAQYTPPPPGTRITQTSQSNTGQPNYDDILNSDPIYQQTLTDLKTGGIANAQQRTAARQRALIQFGFVPDFNQSAGALGLVGSDIPNDINDQVRQLAQQNTDAGTSVSARIDKTYADTVRQIRAALAARGLLSSGELGYQLNNAGLQHDTANYDAQQKLLDLLSGVESAYTSGQQQNAAGLRSAAEGAYTRGIANPPPAGDAGGGGGGGGGGDGGGGTPPVTSQPPAHTDASSTGGYGANSSLGNGPSALLAALQKAGYQKLINNAGTFDSF